MIWIKNDNSIVDQQTNEFQCLLGNHPDELRDKIIEVSPELFAAVVDFVNAADTGSLKARAAYNKFKQVLSRVPEHLLYDERLQIQ